MSLTSSLPSEILDSISLERGGSRKLDDSAHPSLALRHTYTKSKRLQSARYDEQQGAWICRNCGWAYPSPHPKAHERREHKKHCHEALKVQRWLGSAKFGPNDSEDAQEQGPGSDLGRPHDSPAKLFPYPSEVEQTGTKIAADETNAEETTPNERLSSELELAGMDAEKQSTKSIQKRPDSDDVRDEDSVLVQHQDGVNGSGKKSRDHSTITCGGDDKRKRKISEGSACTAKPEITEVNQEKKASLKTDDELLEERQAVEEVKTPMTRQVHESEKMRGRGQERQDVEAGQTSKGRMPHSSASRNWDNWEDVVRDEEMLTEGSGALVRQENDTAARNWEGWEDVVGRMGNLIEGRKSPSLQGAGNSTGQPITDQGRPRQPNDVENFSIEQKQPDDVDQSTRDPVMSQRDAKDVPCPAKLHLAARNWDDWEDVIMTGSTLNLKSLKSASLTNKDVAVMS